MDTRQYSWNTLLSTSLIYNITTHYSDSNSRVLQFSSYRFNFSVGEIFEIFLQFWLDLILNVGGYK